MREVDQLGTEDGEILRAEVREILGAPADRAVLEPLVHNLKNGVTGGVWRVTAGDRSVVLKVLTQAKHADGAWAVFSHLDQWPANVVSHGPDSVLIDWAFAGDGALGEDLGNYIPDTVWDLFLPAARLPELAAAAYEAHVHGLRESGWRGDERLVRLGMCASAVKYDWLAPLMLARAGEARQLDYGGKGEVSAERRYRERGLAFAFLAGWAAEARELAPLLGFPPAPTGR
ncbi:hypothetical protein [Streptomyces sp. NBC_00268]|uniref:hypothetical protein n=1 Tax=unclassified Streptomyces TaxID=2593676 RepID=UPI0022535315|nr:hypothetical protein [Streptomyces sp. NBC_00268]MCX5188091.1 hypothetical protein [Streptomyces sp. NBC_00268]